MYLRARPCDKLVEDLQHFLLYTRLVDLLWDSMPNTHFVLRGSIFYHIHEYNVLNKHKIKLMLFHMQHNLISSFLELKKLIKLI
jgi:hypothetical protein